MGKEEISMIEKLHELQDLLVKSCSKGLEAYCRSLTTNEPMSPGILKEVRELLKDNDITGDYLGKDKGLQALDMELDELLTIAK